MLILRSQERGHVDLGWLKSAHSFSFGSYYNPKMMGFGRLRVINEDWIQGGGGFPLHGHKDMEIITYVMNGALEHKDSVGNNEVIQTGEVQRMSAGSGIRHSEFNHFQDQVTHLLQIWIEPTEMSVTPSYEQLDFTDRFKNSNWVLLASEHSEQDSLKIHTDAKLYALRDKKAGNQVVDCKPGRKYWIQHIQGNLNVSSSLGDVDLKPSDALGLENPSSLKLNWSAPVEALIFEL